MILKRIANRLRRIFPSEHDRVINKWWADGGDYKLRFDYDLNETSVVLDLGGYDGQWASDLFSKYRCRIFVFEPVHEFAEKIKKRFQRNSQIEVFQYGLGGRSRNETIYICADSSSIFRKSINRETICIIDVKKWLEEKNVGRIDLMKINIEGGEYELLERLVEAQLIGAIGNIQVQFHRVADSSGARMERIQNTLTQTHHLTYQYKYVWENWARADKRK
jgi:FkbM family methyltransferase